MITKLRLKNWKSFKDSTVYIDPLTILIGVNASGKSNVLDALDFIRKVSTAKSGNKCLGDSFAQILVDAADEKSPWAAFSEQSNLWKPEKLKQLAEKWRETVIPGQSIGDASIVDVAEYYFKSGFVPEIFTGDEGLKSYEPQGDTFFVPRRRKNK